MKTKFLLSAGLIIATGLSSATMAEVPADEAALQALVDDLQREVAQLQAAQGENWLTEQRAAEVRSLVQDVLADADTRTSLLANGATAGWDKGFYLGSADGNFLLRIQGQLQIRFAYNSQEESPEDDHRWGVENRRTKIDFRGHIIDPTWTYYIEAEAGRDGGAFTLSENGWIQKDLGNGLKILAGQFKPKYLREEGISSRRLQAVERTLVNAEFTAGTAQGVQMNYESAKWRMWAAFIDGISTANTPALSEDTELALTGRVEAMLKGEFKDVDDDIGFRGTADSLAVGGGFSYQKEEFGTATTDELENLGLTADILWKGSGCSISGMIVYRMLDDDAGTDADQIGTVIRGGFFVKDDIELFGVFEWADADTDGVEDLCVLTAGVNKYFDKHTIKWQNDVGYGINEVAGIWSSGGAGWRTDGADEDGQLVFRSQLQLLF